MALAVALTLWASAFAGIRAGLHAYAPAHLALFRYLIASAVLGVYARFAHFRRPECDLPGLVVAGSLGITFYNLALNYGETRVTAGSASLLVASTPIWTALLAMFTLRERRQNLRHGSRRPLREFESGSTIVQASPSLIEPSLEIRSARSIRFALCALNLGCVPAVHFPARRAVRIECKDPRRSPRMLARITHSTVRLLDRLLAYTAASKELPAHQRTGRRGEEEAYSYLRKLGYEMVARNYRSPRRRGKVDLIGWKRDGLCFTEVKTRTTHDVKPVEAAVDRDKPRELSAVARECLRRLPVAPSWRFDVVSVYV